jgi:hypothetical protein
MNYSGGRSEKYVKAERFSRSIVSMARTELKSNPNFVALPPAAIQKRQKFLASVRLPILEPIDTSADGGWLCFVCSAMNKDAGIVGNPYKPVALDTCATCGRRRGYLPVVDVLQPGYDFNKGELGKGSINTGIRELLIHGHFLPTLTELKLNSCGLGDAGAADLCELLRGNKKITILRLWNNGIGDKGAKRIARMLLSNRSIVQLNLGNNRIRNDGARALAGMLRVNPKVSSINLTWNPLSLSEKDTIQALLDLGPELRTMGRATEEKGHEQRMLMMEIEREQEKEEQLEELLEEHEQHVRGEALKEEAGEKALRQFEIRHFGYWHRDATTPAFIMFVGMNYYIAPHLSWGRALRGGEGVAHVVEEEAGGGTAANKAKGSKKDEELEEQLCSPDGIEWDPVLRGSPAAPAVEFMLEVDPTDNVRGVLCDPETGVLNCCTSKPLKPHLLVVTVKYTFTYQSDGSDGSKAGADKTVTIQRSSTPFGVEFLPFSQCPPQMMKDVLSGYGLDMFLQKRYSLLQREMALMRIKRQAPVIQEWDIDDIT